MSPEELYLDLLKKCLTRSIFPEESKPIRLGRKDPRWFLYEPLRAALATKDLELVHRGGFDSDATSNGRVWPLRAETMVGMKRLDNLQACMTEVLREGVPGDFIETGVWRGGACIFMRAVLKVYGDRDRKVWVADSFQGLPKPDAEKYPSDQGDTLWTFQALAVPLAEVKANFERYGMLDGQVRFLQGWFKDTLPAAPISQLAVLRIDGDMYQSTMEALKFLYPKVSPGGFVIIDDYSLQGCRKAVEDFRASYGIKDEIQRIDWTGIFWRRSTSES